MATGTGQKLAGVQAGLTELRNRLLFVFFCFARVSHGHAYSGAWN